MLKPGKKAVLFDMWGTLIYEEPLFTAAGPGGYFGAASAALGVTLEAFTSARNATVLEAMTGRMDGLARALYIMKLLDLPLDRTQAQYISDLEDQLRQPSIHFYPNTISTLTAVRTLGYRTALVSNCTSVFPPIVKHLGLAGMLDTLVLSCELGAAKPDPKIFKTACAALEVAPTQCFYVGDGGDNEMAASRALGMTPILIVQPGSHSAVYEAPLGGQEFTVHDLSEVLDLISDLA